MSICNVVRASLIAISFAICTASLFSQDSNLLENPSFEGRPQRGTSYQMPIKGWIDWTMFPGASPPDVHGAYTQYWGVRTMPYEGETFLGLVVRETGSWEAVGQALKERMLPNTRYALSLHLCMDKNYVSPVGIPDPSQPQDVASFGNPAVVRIWGSNKKRGLDELLAESPPVANETWQEFVMEFTPTDAFRYLVIEAYYIDDKGRYNGNIMVDSVRLVRL